MENAFRFKNTAAARLTPGQVVEIRERYAEGESQAALSRAFQVSVNQIGRIVRGESWQRLPMGMATKQEQEKTLQNLLRVQKEVEEFGVVREQPPESSPLPGISRLSEEAAKKAAVFGVGQEMLEELSRLPKSPLDE